MKLALSEKLKTKRLSKKLTQVDLARIMNPSQSRVAKMEAGDPAVSIDLLIKSLLALGVSKIALIFMPIVGMSVFAAGMPVQVLYVYLAVSIITFIIYAIDKSAARKGAWRKQESTLHMLALFGGWPGHWLRSKPCATSRAKGLSGLCFG